MAKCLECALLHCQLQNLLFISCKLHQSTHQVNPDSPFARCPCHLLHHQGSNATSTKDWPLLLANLMLETNNQHLVNHLLTSFNSRGNALNGNSPLASSCPTDESNGRTKQVPANDSKFNSMHKKDSSINYCDSEGAIKSTSVESRVFSKSHFHRPHEQGKISPSPPAVFPLSGSSYSPSSRSLEEKLYACHPPKTSGHISQPQEQQPEDASSPPKCKRVKLADLPDSTTVDQSQLIAKSIGSKLRQLAESFHSLQIASGNHDT